MSRSLKILNTSDDAAIDIALDTFRIQKQALIFTNSKRSAEKTAEDIAKKLKPAGEEFDLLAEKILNSLSKATTQCERLAKCIRKGVAFHHAGLSHGQKELIEDNFRNNKIKIIACTPTLALGVDLPAFRAVLKSLRRYSGAFGMAYIPVLEAQQMFGRAGRPGKEEYGEAICIASTEAEKEEIIDVFLNGKPEPIYSKLAVEPVLRTTLLSLIATGIVRSKKQVMDFFSETFWAYHYKDMDRLERIIMKMLSLLRDFTFITIKGELESDFVSADDLIAPEDDSEKIIFRATLLGERVSQLYIDPLTAHSLILGMEKALSTKTNDLSFLHLISNTLEMRPLLKVKVSEQDAITDELLKNSDSILCEEPSMFDEEYEDYVNAMKTSLMFNDWIEEKDEEYLLEKYGIRPGEFKVKQDLADWLLFCSIELSKILGHKELYSPMNRLRIRLEHGVKEELLPLLSLEQVGRVRARKMFSNGIKDIGDVKKADQTTLAQLLGQKIAENIKKQVGEKIAEQEISQKKRKGQMSIRKYEKNKEE